MGGELFMNIQRRYRTPLYLSAAMAIAIAHPAIAQDAQSASASQAAGGQAAESQADEAAARSGVGDIIVTARRQSESVQKVPISISAFSSELLEAKNLDDIADVARNVPNVQLDAVSSESGAASTQIAIRGIGQTDYVLTVEPAVGVYLDGVYVGKSLGSLLDTVDVERVEVLRGPQGTLFGKNTLAGAISVITKRPSQDLEYQFEASTGSFRRLDARASISGPISDWLRYRISASYRSANGFLERALLDGRRTGVFQGDINRFNARAKFEADVTPDVLATLTLDSSRIRETSPATFLVRVNERVGFPRLFNLNVPGGACLPTEPTRFGNPYCYNSQYALPIDSRITYGAGGNTSNTDTRGATLTVDWTMGDSALKSITAYRDVKVFVDQDLGGTPYYNSQVGQDITFRQFSQELQFSGKAFSDRLSYVLGGYYSRETGRQLFPVETQFVQFLSGGDVRSRSLAVFGQMTFDITDRLSLTGGYRYTDEQREFNPGLQQVVGYEILSVKPIPGFVNPVVNAFGVPGQALFPAGWYKRKSSSGTPMASLRWEATDDINFYATYSEGFKGGGFSMRFFPPIIPAPGTDPDTIVPYAGPERAKSYEIGMKGQFFDRKLKFNISAFRTNYSDLQVTYNLDPDGPGPIGKIVPTLANAGNARMQGIEIESSAMLADWLSIDGSLGYLEAKYQSFTAQALANFPQALSLVPPNAPKWTYNLGALITPFDNHNGRLSARIDWNYRSGQFKEFANDPALFQPAYGVLNASVSYRSPDKRWEAQIGGTNITNKAYIVSGVASDRAQAVRSRPAEWFLTLKFRN